ncbi:MAG: FkbM family methyltransferase [Promethearchaeota archaeon]|nr:MAG: FkbM family methyltransferase [Candidatus Lokiarchaeota archaeon]
MSVLKTLGRLKRTVKKRLIFLFKNKEINFKDRLKLSYRLGLNNAIKAYIKDCLEVSEEGEQYFSIGHKQIFFRHSYEVKNEEKFINGITMVIHEMLFFPDFFHKKVKVHQGDIVLDVGAFMGLSSIHLSKHVGPEGFVYAIEPVIPDTLQKNLKANEVSNVKCLPFAVGEKKGDLEIEISDFIADSSITKREYTQEYYTQTKNVEVRTIDSLVKELGLDRVDYVKMDIEGAEELALRGAEGVLKEFKPKLSISSYHIDFENEPQHDKLVRLLKEYGYTLKEKRKSHIYAWWE